MKLIAFYLPQFHDIPENDEWWGKGFTEWTNVRKAKPLFEGHNQPVIPQNNNYYNLLDNDTKRWQAELAKQYGIHGFCYYHYWFNGKMLLEKPMEQMLEDSSIDIPFCICWANEPWTKAWVNETKVLIPQKYGSRDEWRQHFDYLLPFFKDNRYITESGKPLMVIYRPDVIPDLNQMLDCWNNWAIEEDLGGLTFAYQQLVRDWGNNDDSRFDLDIEFQPGLVTTRDAIEHGFRSTVFWKTLRACKDKILMFLEKKTGVDYRQELNKRVTGNRTTPRLLDYDEIWERIISTPPDSEKSVAGAFVRWDNTPRKECRGEVITGASPEKFQHYLEQLFLKVENCYKTDLVFINAWNEWAEGAFLEPTESDGLSYLSAIKNALEYTAVKGDVK